MPSAPRFHVTQDAAFLYVHVHVPYVRVSEMEFHVDGCHFSFYCKPYLLKLQFPHEVVDDELAKAVYDPNKDHGTIVVHLPKQEPGVEFSDLDLLTKLMQPKKAPDVDLQARSTPAPLIEVIQSTSADATRDASFITTDATNPTRGDATLLELEKRFAQVAEDEAASHTVKVTALKPRYGFQNAYADVFRGWHGDTSEILSLPEPENTPAEQRRRLRETGEDAHFDIERYLLDFANARDDEYLAMALEHVPHWHRHPILTLSTQPVTTGLSKRPLIAEVTESTAVPTSETVAFQINSLSLGTPSADTPPAVTADAAAVLTDNDRELLQRLPNKEFLLPKGSTEERLIFGGLLDILIGYVYEQLTTQGDSGIESTWTISILSPTLAWLDTSADVATVIRAGVRRMLTFPLLRQYELATHVVSKTAALLRRGKRVVLHCLLDVFRIVEKSETQYLLNTIYIQDYCIWIQTISDEQLVRLADDVAACLAKFRKADSGWALEELEQQLLEADDSEEGEGNVGETSGESSAEDSSDEDESSSESDSEEEGENASVEATTSPAVALSSS